MARTIRHQPSEARVALVNRGGKGFHGGSKRLKNRRERKGARLDLRKEYA
jgi:hypothetical protein